MKRFLLAFLVCLLAISAKSEIHTYMGTSYAIAKVSRYGNYSWSDWYSCDVMIVFDTDRLLVGIDSYEPQVYRIYNYSGYKFDQKGGYQAIFDVIDKDGDYGQMRIRVTTDAYGNITNSQLYIDFKNVAWVYNIREILF